MLTGNVVNAIKNIRLDTVSSRNIKLWSNATTHCQKLKKRRAAKRATQEAKAKRSAYCKVYYQTKKNSETFKAKSRANAAAWAAKNKDRVRQLARLRSGCTSIPYPAPKRCECCGRLFSETKKGAHLDHDHITGAFRGWLCSTCNSGIGHLGDNMAGLQRASQYLRSSAIEMLSLT